LKTMAPVCRIGQTARRNLFPGNVNPISEWIRVDRLRLRVIAVLGEKVRSPTGADQDNQIFVPLTTLQRRLVGEERIGLVLAAARSEGTIERAKAEIVRVMRERHHVKPGAPDDFDVSTVREMAQLAEILATT